MTLHHTMGAVARATPTTDLLSDLDRLHELATMIINEHVNDAGLCAVCRGVAFPCESAVLAEHNAALL